jgi:hypothetical protein
VLRRERKRQAALPEDNKGCKRIPRNLEAVKWHQDTQRQTRRHALALDAAPESGLAGQMALALEQGALGESARASA